MCQSASINLMQSGYGTLGRDLMIRTTMWRPRSRQTCTTLPMGFLGGLLILALSDGALGCQRSSSDPMDSYQGNGDLVLQGYQADEDDEADEDEELSEDDDQEDLQIVCGGEVAPTRARRLPGAIVIGARKGGTRALLEFAKINPKVRAAAQEVHFFDRHFSKGLNWYAAQMKAVTPDEVALEKTPAYFHHHEVSGGGEDLPARVRQMDPEVKLLLILRDPVDRMASDYNQLRHRRLDRFNATGTLEYPALEDLVFSGPSSSVNTKYPPLQRSLYHQHLARWLAHFPLDQIHVVDGDRFIRAPWEEMTPVERFLGLEPVITRDNFYFNETKGHFCVRDVRSLGAWRCTREKCLGSSKGRPKVPLSPDTVHRLQDFFRPHNRLLYNMLGKELDWPAASPGQD